MTELQKKEFDILRAFVTACEKLELSYFLVCGSALGAVKYGGFIPWDDDIDVALPRRDYEIFLARAKDVLPDWCFVQNYRTDPCFHLLGTKLRDSRTTFVESMCEGLNIHHGVFIDVFPLDGHWDTPKAYKRIRRQRRVFDGKRRVHLEYNRFSPANLLSTRTFFYYISNRLFGLYGDTAKAIARFEGVISAFPTDESDVWCNHANSSSPREFAPRNQYGKGAEAIFEGLQIRIPERYDEYLAQKYGDWRAELPEEQKVGHHDHVIFDPNRSYRDYIEETSADGRKIRLRQTKKKS